MKELFKAIAAFQQECPTIHKDTQGYGYSYADLPSIFEVINPILKKHKLGFMQAVEGSNLETTVFHTETGESITKAAEIPQGVALKGMNEFQVLGSAITYMRRYQLSAMLGIVTDKDTDASGEQEKKKWLNPGTSEWKEAIVFVAQNGARGIDKIKRKYSISKSNEDLLIKESEL